MPMLAKYRFIDENWVMETLPSQNECGLTDELLRGAPFLFSAAPMIIDCSGDVYNSREQLIQRTLEQTVFEPWPDGPKSAFILGGKELDQFAEIYADTLVSGEVVREVQKLRVAYGLDEGVAFGRDDAVDLGQYKDILNFIITHPNEYSFEQQSLINKMLNARIDFGFSIKIFTDEKSEWTREAKLGRPIEPERNYLPESFPLSPII